MELLHILFLKTTTAADSRHLFRIACEQLNPVTAASQKIQQQNSYPALSYTNSNKLIKHGFGSQMKPADSCHYLVVSQWYSCIAIFLTCIQKCLKSFVTRLGYTWSALVLPAAPGLEQVLSCFAIKSRMDQESRWLTRSLNHNTLNCHLWLKWCEDEFTWMWGVAMSRDCRLQKLGGIFVYFPGVFVFDGLWLHAGAPLCCWERIRCHGLKFLQGGRVVIACGRSRHVRYNRTRVSIIFNSLQFTIYIL